MLTLLTLPGVWLTLLAALVCQWAWAAWGGQHWLFDWWTLGILAALALAGEILEMVSSAIGAKRSGGGTSGALGSIVSSGHAVSWPPPGDPGRQRAVQRWA